MPKNKTDNLQQKFPEIVFSEGMQPLPMIQADSGQPRIVAKPAYSGGKLYINGYDQPVVLDLQSFKTDEVSFVLYHDINMPLGTASEITNDGKELAASGPLTHGHKDYAKDEIIAARNGFRHRPSVTVYSPKREDVTFIQAGQSILANGRKQDGPFFYVKNGFLKNIALVTTPGDPNSHAQIIAQSSNSYQGEHFMPETKNPGVAENQTTTTPQQDATAQSPASTAPVQAPSQKEQTSQTTSASQTPVSTPPSAPPAEIQAQAAQPSGDALIANQNRIAAIQSAGFLPEIAAQAIAGGWSFETAKEKNAVMTGAVPGNHAGFQNVERNKNDQPGELEMIVASACQTAGLNADELKAAGFREQVINELESNYAWRGAWLHDIMAHCVEAMESGQNRNTQGQQRHYRRGRPTARYSGESLCYAAIEAQAAFDNRFGSAFDIGFNEIRADADTGFSTQGLRQVWTLITRATVLKAYNGVPSTWQYICKKIFTKDFRPHTAHRTEMVGDYARTGEVGNEPPHATYAEQMFTIASDQWDLMVAIPWKDLVGDEPGVFNDRAQKLGRLAKRKYQSVVYTALLSAGNQLFKKSRTAGEKERFPHGNFVDGADSALGLKGVSLAKKAMALAKNPMSGELLGLKAKYLLVPGVREEEAKYFLSETRIGGNVHGSLNPHLDLTLVAEPLLNADNGLRTGKGEDKNMPGDDDAFYLFSDPNGDAPALGIAFYQGQEAPRIQTAETRFSTDGIQTKGTICFDVGTLDYRGAVKSKGKA